MARNGPTWTRARINRVIRLRFGTNSRGGPDLAACAGQMGVTPRSVQRWLHASSGRALAPIPPRRLEQLLELLLPAEDTLRREAQQARYARKAIGQLYLGRRRGIKPAWERQRWLEQHIVLVLAVREHKIRQIVITRATRKHLDDVRRRGTVIDQAVVPTRFHATVLVHHVLTRLHPWRYRAGGDQVAAGYTQVWLDDAPAISLTAAASQDIYVE